MKKVIVTGGAGFLGAVLVEELLKKDYEVWSIVRKGSEHNRRIERLIEQGGAVHIVFGQLDRLLSLICDLPKDCDYFFHLAWTGDPSVRSQDENIAGILQAVELAEDCGCKRFIATGSQAEYGAVSSDILMTEELPCYPVTAYGAAKVAACHLSRVRARELGMEWVWARIFSLIGKYEPRGRMLPDLYRALCEGRTMELSSCEQNWDYLDVHDAAEALIALAEKGHDGEICNVANGAYRPLKEYTEELRRMVAPDATISYGGRAEPFISLQPSVEKLQQDTGWKPVRSFAESIRDYDETQQERSG